ncbi:nucleotidyltransferase domain-containing protein [Aeromonas enteropelogenes]|uniref:nucleotidyltransferase domain-containing protein n=1 Tax=Aeromonas enteropelogenes TaxID=29489 RepID=UPI003BA2E5A0
MTATEVANYLIRTCKTLKEFDAFMFGSSLYHIGSDYDILIVGPSGESLYRLKEELKIAGQELPLDLLYMLPEEETETQFVANEGCIPLWQLVKGLPPSKVQL